MSKNGFFFGHSNTNIEIWDKSVIELENYYVVPVSMKYVYECKEEPNFYGFAVSLFQKNQILLWSIFTKNIAIYTKESSSFLRNTQNLKNLPHGFEKSADFLSNDLSVGSTETKN